MRRLTVALLAFAAYWAPAPVAAQDSPLDPKEWTVPWERTRPRDPVAAPDGKVWFVGQTGNYIAYLDPKAGEFKRFEIAEGTNPHNIVVDPKGGIWYTGNRNGRIVKLDPATGELKNFMTDSTVRDPHTMLFDQNGVAWFSAQRSNKIGRLDPATGKLRYFDPSAPRSGPYGVVIDSKGRPYIDLFGTNKIATIDPQTMEYREYTLPHERARSRRLAVTSDDAVWYGDVSRGMIGRLDPASGKIEEWELPSGARSLPYAMTVDDQDRLWLVETGVNPNKLVAFDAKTRQFVANIPILSNGAERNTVRHMTFDKASRKIWFGTDAGTIGGVIIPVEIPKIVP